MNWKVTVLLCLVFLATTVVTGVANTAMSSLASLQNMISVGSHAILDAASVEPAGGDPVDIVDAPT